MVLKKLITSLSSTSLMAATVFASEVDKENESKQLVRPRELSIYSQPEKKPEKAKESEEESSLQAAVRQVREGVWAVTDQFSLVTDQVNHVIDTGKAHTSTAIQRLREEENYAQRYGAIAGGGLVGYIFAIRRGFFKKILYTTAGAAAVAAVCYPEEADQYFSEGYRETKHYVVIAYHFLNGVLRDYAGVELPSLPGPLAIGSGGGGDKDPPSSAALMPPPASGPSHIPAGPIPLPPLDNPSSVAGDKKKQGTDETKSSSEDNEESNETQPEPKPLSFQPKDPRKSLAENVDDYSSLYTRRGI